MHQQTLPIGNLAAWARLNNVRLHGVEVSPLADDRGSGVIATTDLAHGFDPLMTIPQDLILSMENVWVFAKSDRHLSQVLEATGEFSRVSEFSTGAEQQGLTSFRLREAQS